MRERDWERCQRTQRNTDIGQNKCNRADNEYTDINIIKI